MLYSISYFLKYTLNSQKALHITHILRVHITCIKKVIES